MSPEISCLRLPYQWIVILVAAAIYLGCAVSPPDLMDDVDSVQASIAHNMVVTGDWVTPQLDGIKYLEKPPLKYWIIATFFEVFGVHDWAARLPLALIDVLLCWLVFRMGAWGFGEGAGLYAGLAIASCIGLFLFTRILIADSQLTVAVTLGLWSFLRALDLDERRPRLWGLLFWICIALAILLKGLIGAVFPLAAALFYLLFTKQLLARDTWHRLVPWWGVAALLLIAAPWHILATLRNPPYLRFDLTSGPGHYRGFFWFYFFNEHLLRFLNRRFPRDYNTVPRLWFWLLNLVWLFPASAYLPAIFRLRYRGDDRATRLRLLALCWIGFVMIFFTFSSTQEYYSMPIYPAVALLLGCGLASAEPKIRVWLRRGDILLVVICTLALTAMLVILLRVWNLPSPGDIASALRSQNEAAYTLSLGHMGDLTLDSFAYLRTPLLIAAAAVALGLGGLFFIDRRERMIPLTIMMVLFFHAARLALIAFDPYLSSRALAEALKQSPRGQLIVSDQYYAFSSVFFYANTTAYLLNGRINNLEYGSNAPNAPNVFIDSKELASRWHSRDRYYLLLEHEYLPEISQVIGRDFAIVKESGGKYLLTNAPIK